MSSPLPECLRKRVQEAYTIAEYSKFMQIVCSFQSGSISHEVANKKVFQMLEFNGIPTALDDSRKSRRPDLYNTFVQWSAPVQVGAVCFEFLSTKVLVKDMNNLDSALVLIIPALEMRVVKMSNTITFGYLAHPVIFLNDLKIMIEAYHAADTDDISKKLIVEAFATDQYKKQSYNERVDLVPFAGEYMYEGSDIQRLTCMKPNTMRLMDLELSLPWLMEKVSVYTEMRLKIDKTLGNWRVAVSRNDDNKAKQLFDPKVAGTRAPRPPNAHKFGVYLYDTQIQFDEKQLLGVLERIKIKAEIEQNMLQHHRIAQENIRATMLLLSECSPMMQTALRTGVGEPSVAVSVGTVRLIWEKELNRRSTMTLPHQADMHSY